MRHPILVRLLRLLRPDAKPDDVADVVQALLQAEAQDAKSDVKQWITPENGTHVPVGKNGVIQGKGGLSGQKYDPGKGTRRTATDPKGHTVTKSYDPDDYENVSVGFKGNTEETPTGRIQERGRRIDHKKRHAENDAQYDADGVRFLSRPLDENTEEIKLTDGKRMRYNYRTNEYGVANEQGDMATYYKPKDGIKYWEGKVQRYGRKQ